MSMWPRGGYASGSVKASEMTPPPVSAQSRFHREWCPKTLREKLCTQQTHAPDEFTRREIQRLIDVLDLHRPLGSNGKHGTLHTPTCGCEDR